MRMTRKPNSFGTNEAMSDQASSMPWLHSTARMFMVAAFLGCRPVRLAPARVVVDEELSFVWWHDDGGVDGRSAEDPVPWLSEQDVTAAERGAPNGRDGAACSEEARADRHPVGVTGDRIGIDVDDHAKGLAVLVDHSPIQPVRQRGVPREAHRGSPGLKRARRRALRRGALAAAAGPRPRWRPDRA